MRAAAQISLSVIASPEAVDALVLVKTLEQKLQTANKELTIKHSDLSSSSSSRRQEDFNEQESKVRRRFPQWPMVNKCDWPVILELLCDNDSNTRATMTLLVPLVHLDGRVTEVAVVITEIVEKLISAVNYQNEKDRLVRELSILALMSFSLISEDNAFATICTAFRNDAINDVREMAWKAIMAANPSRAEQERRNLQTVVSQVQDFEVWLDECGKSKLEKLKFENSLQQSLLHQSGQLNIARGGLCPTNATEAILFSLRSAHDGQGCMSMLDAVAAAGYHDPVVDAATLVNPLLQLLVHHGNSDVIMCCCLSLAQLLPEGSSARSQPVILEASEHMMNLLSHEDRFVRAAAALSLGALGISSATGMLVHLWRCDFISDVRAASLAALSLMPGEQAQHFLDQEKEITQLKLKVQCAT